MSSLPNAFSLLSQPWEAIKHPAFPSSFNFSAALRDLCPASIKEGLNKAKTPYIAFTIYHQIYI
jgi:hypothetical protein